MPSTKKTVKKKTVPRHALVVKRHGHTEKFDERKIYASVYAACRGSHLGEEQSERIAEVVAEKVKMKLSGKVKIGSHEIFKLAARELELLNEDAAFMFEHHLDIS